MVAIRRLCDNDRQVISLRRALVETKREKPEAARQIAELEQALDSCDHVCDQTSQYIAHTANTARRPNVPAWNMRMKDLTEARTAICMVAIVLDRDILRRKNFIEIFPVPQFDVMEDLRLWVPDDAITELHKFWREHVRSINELSRQPLSRLKTVSGSR
jgi:hypothetical protein